MVYLLAAVGALTIAVLMWRAFGPQTADIAQRRRPASLAPDDDPDFLRKLDESRRRKRDEDTPPA
ncbi:hypothetical protein ACTG9Q_03710 [Actinokineospora sp. 24-640]